ncbi:hypothetical protein SAMN05428997_14618 [Bosea sp. CRIB-10]|uniref:hypothetical protein n=1 Tax=Bosea sp. CRIB-10 TaxID=378404 RepID=UPI0008E2B2C6|nr:hypothetical protein [Bosea sp. CRIB-10]SFD72759.1 hypothetical protein SAMN05428997_14618 [Bosea sp. CRIB-10]
MRRFTEQEERALVKLNLLASNFSTLDITRDRPSTYQRLADRGLAVIEQARCRKRARLTSTGRYFAELVAAKAAREAAATAHISRRA